MPIRPGAARPRLNRPRRVAPRTITTASSKASPNQQRKRVRAKESSTGNYRNMNPSRFRNG